jgi:hypothetical protein
MVEMTESEFAQLVEQLVKNVLDELRKYRGVTYSGMPRLH